MLATTPARRAGSARTTATSLSRPGPRISFPATRISRSTCSSATRERDEAPRAGGAGGGGRRRRVLARLLGLRQGGLPWRAAAAADLRSDGAGHRDPATRTRARGVVYGARPPRRSLALAHRDPAGRDGGAPRPPRRPDRGRAGRGHPDGDPTG